MLCRRPLALLLVFSLGGLLAALVGCSRPTVASPGGGRLSAAEPDSVALVAKNGDKDPAADARKDADAPAFQFPEDAGGALLAKVLPPAEVNGPLNDPNPGPRRSPTAPGLDTPVLSLPLPPSLAPPPPGPGEHARKAPAPHLIVEETLGLGHGDPEPPQPRSFFVGDRTRLPSVDVNEPIPLPTLAQPTVDRASLDDPTADASTVAALAAPMPQRTKAVPYFRVTLPDPFDNRRPTTLTAPAEDDSPRTGTVHPPEPIHPPDPMKK